MLIVVLKESLFFVMNGTIGNRIYVMLMLMITTTIIITIAMTTTTIII
jgi:hypothetical protein